MRKPQFRGHKAAVFEVKRFEEADWGSMAGSP
jgi:hypothetical protein